MGNFRQRKLAQDGDPQKNPFQIKQQANRMGLQLNKAAHSSGKREKVN
jgi:hypothetical protein